MSKLKDEPKHKHLRLSQAKISRARKILGARTETDAIERALDFVIAEDKRNRAAWLAQERFLADAVGAGAEIRDVFGALDRGD
jgi:hypothetical protein